MCKWRWAEKGGGGGGDCLLGVFVCKPALSLYCSKLQYLQLHHVDDTVHSVLI